MLGEQPAGADEHLVALDHALHAAAGDRAEDGGRGRQRQAALCAAAHHGLAKRVLAGPLHAGGQAQHLIRGQIGAGPRHR